MQVILNDFECIVGEYTCRWLRTPADDSSVHRPPPPQQPGCSSLQFWTQKPVCPNLDQKLMCQNPKPGNKLWTIISTGHPRLWKYQLCIKRIFKWQSTTFAPYLTFVAYLTSPWQLAEIVTLCIFSKAICDQDFSTIVRVCIRTEVCHKFDQNLCF